MSTGHPPAPLANAPSRAPAEWRHYLVLLVYATVFVCVPIVAIDSASNDSLRVAVFTTLYFVVLTGLLVAYNWRHDRRRQAHFAEMIAVSRRPQTASLMPDPRYLRRFVLWRVPIIAALCLISLASQSFLVMVEILIPFVIASAAITAIHWHADVPRLVGTHEGLITRTYGLIAWPEISEIYVADSGKSHVLQLWLQDRLKITRRAIFARTRVGRRLEGFGHRRTGPLAPIAQRSVLLDLDQYKLDLEALADRKL